MSHQYGAASFSKQSSIIYNPILLQGRIAIILATANYTIKKVKVCDRCQNIIHEQKLSILKCIHGVLMCMIYMFNCSLWHNPLGMWSLLKLDIDISTNTSTSSVSKWPKRFKHILQCSFTRWIILNWQKLKYVSNYLDRTLTSSTPRADYLAVSDNNTNRSCTWESYVLEKDIDILMQKNKIEPQACKNIFTIFKWQDSLQDFVIIIIFTYMNSNNLTHFKNTLW